MNDWVTVNDAPILDLTTGMTLEARVGGRLCESAANGAGVLWATVTRIEPGRYLQLQGSLGSAHAVQAVVGFTLAPAPGGRTTLTVEHRMAGQLTSGMRAGYARGWDDLLGVRLKALAENGERLGLSPAPRRPRRGQTVRRRRATRGD